MQSFSASNTLFKRTGRWNTTSNDSIISYWAGACLAFVYNGTESLRLLTGPATERKDRFNGGTPTLSVSFRQLSGVKRRFRKAYNVEGSQEIDLRGDVIASEIGLVLVEVTLIDWASVLELQTILIGENDTLQSLPPTNSVNTLIIGDSISCGWTDGSDTMSFGCLSAFPYVMKERLWEDDVDISLSLVAYPGMTLVDGDDVLGMESKFFQVSPWDSEVAMVEERPSVIIIALGTNDEAQDIPATKFCSSMILFVDRLLAVMETSCQHIVFLESFQDFNEAELTEDSGYSLEAVISTLSISHPYVSFHFTRVRPHIRSEHTMDGLHLSQSGHTALGRVLQEELTPVLRYTVQARESPLRVVIPEILSAIENGKMLRDQGPVKTMKIELFGRPAAIKFGTRVRRGEANALEFISNMASKNSIPIPKLIGVWSSPAGSNETTLYTVTEWIDDAQTLEAAWSLLEPSDKTAVIQQLRTIISALRRLTPSDGLSYIGAVGHLPCTDDMLYDMGPFDSVGAFIDGYKFACRSYIKGHYERILDRVFDRWHTYPIVLTHGDLCPSNILVRRTSDSGQWIIAALIDWELAGWYPAHWEYVTLLNAIRWKSEWAEVAQHLLEKHYDDDFILDSKYRFYLRL